AAITTTPMTIVRRSRHAPSALRRAAPRDTGATAAGVPAEATGRTAATAGVGSATAAARTDRGIARSRHTSATTPITPNWTSSGTRPHAAAAPTPEPRTLPTENAAWNWGTIVRFIARSMATVSRFIGTLPSAKDVL